MARNNRRMRANDNEDSRRMKNAYDNATAFITKDGSTIRELMHPGPHASLGVCAQSFAEATVEPGASTLAHLHRRSEEIYHVTAGTGLMMLGEDSFEIGVGDTVVIVPGTRHCVTNTGAASLRFLCACSPAYSDDDTVML